MATGYTVNYNLSQCVTPTTVNFNSLTGVYIHLLNAVSARYTIIVRTNLGTLTIKTCDYCHYHP